MLPCSGGVLDVEHVRIPPGLHVLRVLLGSLRDLCDNLRHLALLEGVILLDYLLVEPVGVFDPGHGVGSALEIRRDGDDLLDGAAQSLEVLVPVQQLADVGVSDAVDLLPDAVDLLPPKVLLPDAGLGLEDGHGDSPLRHRRSVRLLGDDEPAGYAGVLDHLVPQSLGSGDGGELLALVL